MTATSLGSDKTCCHRVARSCRRCHVPMTESRSMYSEVCLMQPWRMVCHSLKSKLTRIGRKRAGVRRLMSKCIDIRGSLNQTRIPYEPSRSCCDALNPLIHTTEDRSRDEDGPCCVCYEGESHSFDSARYLAKPETVRRLMMIGQMW